MKRYKILLLVHHEKEILAVDDKAAHAEAVRLSKLGKTDDTDPDSLISTIEFIRDEPDPVEFDFES